MAKELRSADISKVEEDEMIPLLDRTALLTIMNEEKLDHPEEVI